MELRKIDRPAVTAKKMENGGHKLGGTPMDFEVFFRLKNKELARYQFAVETPADIQAGFINALEAFRVQHPEVDLLADGILMLIQKRAA